MKRHADALTIEHIIELRKKLAEAERQRDNALEFVSDMKKIDIKAVKEIAYKIYWEAETRKATHLAHELIKKLGD